MNFNIGIYALLCNSVSWLIASCLLCLYKVNGSGRQCAGCLIVYKMYGRRYVSVISPL